MSTLTRARIASGFVLFSLTSLGVLIVGGVTIAALASIATNSVNALAVTAVCFCGLLPVLGWFLNLLCRLDEWAVQTLAGVEAPAVVRDPVGGSVGDSLAASEQGGR